MLTAVKLPPGVARMGTDGITRGRYWDANLSRWRNGALMPVGGWQRITPTPLASTPRRIWSWRTNDDVRHIAVICDNHIYTSEGGTYTDRTPDDYGEEGQQIGVAGYGIGKYSAGTYGTPRAAGDTVLYRRGGGWSMDNFGEDLLLVASSDGRLLLLSPRAVVVNGRTQYALPEKAAPVVGAPTANRAMVVTEERHVMLFGAGGNPRRVAWCSREDYLDWDFADITNSAGFFDLDIPGWIVHACKVRGGVLIFTDSEVWVARYRGQPSIYGFERVGKGCSLIAPQAFATASGSVFWMARDGFWFFDGAAARPLPCEVGNFVFGQTEGEASLVRPHAAGNGLFSEVWFFYPSPGAEECDRYVVYNYDERWWTIGALPRTAALEGGVYPYPLMTGVDRNLYEHEKGWTAAGVPRLTDVYAETAAFSVGGGERTMHVMGAQMDSGHGYDATRFSAYTRDTRDGTETVEGPFVPRSDGWTDARFSGRDIRLRIESTHDAAWSVGEMRFDVRQGGRR